MPTLTDLLLKGISTKMEAGSMEVISELPQSLLSLKSMEKALQIKDFAKRNRTPASIRIVSKRVPGYGNG